MLVSIFCPSAVSITRTRGLCFIPSLYTSLNPCREAFLRAHCRSMQDSVVIAVGQIEHREIILSDAESHLIINLKDDSTANIVVRLNTSAEQTVCHIEAVVGAHAQCTILFINEASPESSVTITQRGEVGEGGVLRWQNVTLGGKSVAHDLVSHCSGHDAESAVDWMFYGKGTEKQELTVRNIFDGRNGRGEILMRGVAEGKAFAVAKGMIEIGLGGGGTNTYLTQNVLMLDTTSK